ncbi:ICP22 family protein [Mycolicibacterium palauense]|uniref:hypothetical protein n=1 Tax=Mycolicibacterium palauense TaxID=2034511 RepID=UPI001145F1C8|nr:hypothetical protein [Mycolicibacterium palauense]
MVGMEKYVGRVGALAVALGIGAAVAAVPPQAWAQPGDTTSAKSSERGAARAAGHTKTRHSSSPGASARRGAGSSHTSASDRADRSRASGGDDDAATGSRPLNRRRHDSRSDTDDASTSAPDKRSDASDSGDTGPDSTQKPADDRSADESSEPPTKQPKTKQASRPKSQPTGQPEKADPADASPVSGAAGQDAEPDTKDTESGTGPDSETNSEPNTQPDTETNSEPNTATETPEATPTATVRTLSSPPPSSRTSDAPDTPVDSPLWALALAYVRRQFGPDKTGTATTATADVSQQSDSAAAADTDATSIPGTATTPTVVGADGTVYQVTTDVDSDGLATGTTRVSIIGADGQVLTTRDIRGAATTTLPVTRPDGSLVVATYVRSLNRTIISVVNDRGRVHRVRSVSGEPVSQLSVAPNGTTFLQTRQSAAGLWGGLGYRLVRVSKFNTARAYSALIAPGAPVVGPDGSAYMLKYTSFLGTSAMLAVGPHGLSRTIPLPMGSADAVEPVIGGDGRAYFAISPQRGDYTTTRVFSYKGIFSTAHDVPGITRDSLISAGDGVYFLTYNYLAHQDWVSHVTATDATTVLLNGSENTPLRVTPDGTVYLAVNNSSGTPTDSVVFINSDGDTTVVPLPGDVYSMGSWPVSDYGTPDPNAYMPYYVDDRYYLAVVTPDGTVTDTLTMPEGSTIREPVSFDPDGNTYQLIQTVDESYKTTGAAVVAVETGAVTATLPGTVVGGHNSIEFGPDGTGYLVTQEGSVAAPTYHILAFDRDGNTVASLDVDAGLVPRREQYRTLGLLDEPLVFAPDGTAYATFEGEDGGVWAINASGATKVLDVTADDIVYAVTIGADGTPYLTTSTRVGDQDVTTVRTITATTTA